MSMRHLIFFYNLYYYRIKVNFLIIIFTCRFNKMNYTFLISVSLSDWSDSHQIALLVWYLVDMQKFFNSVLCRSFFYRVLN